MQQYGWVSKTHWVKRAYILYAHIYIKFYNRQNYSVIELKSVLLVWGEGIVVGTKKGQKEAFWGSGIFYTVTQAIRICQQMT